MVGANDNVYYIKNADSIFPLDYDFSKKNSFDKRNRLRPEFIRTYEKKLNPDALLEAGSNKQLDQSDVELSEANRTMVRRNFTALLRSLESLNLLPTDSESLEQVFDFHGVNMRYLG